VDATDTGEHPVGVEVEDGIEAPVDSIQITFVIRQLLENAASFSPQDAPIDLAIRRDGPDVVIEVRDRGPGIPSEQREAVFERFAGWRPPDYEDRPGTGLGLYISRAIAREHGGDASVADAPEGGTMLGVRLPAEERMAGTP
jgi:signal transduction histidine kinase